MVEQVVEVTAVVEQVVEQVAATVLSTPLTQMLVLYNDRAIDAQCNSVQPSDACMLYVIVCCVCGRARARACVPSHVCYRWTSCARKAELDSNATRLVRKKLQPWSCPGPGNCYEFVRTLVTKRAFTGILGMQAVFSHVVR